MTKLIKDWKELSKVLPNDKYRIIVDKDMCSGWIVPVCDYQDDEDDLTDDGYDFLILYTQQQILSEHQREYNRAVFGQESGIINY